MTDLRGPMMLTPSVKNFDHTPSLDALRRINRMEMGYDRQSI